MASHRLDILFEDDHFVAIHKPAGIPVIPERFPTNQPSLHELMDQRYGKTFVVHRLDRETTGALVFARTAEAHRGLSIQFQENTIIKIYHALVSGEPLWEAETVDLPLRMNGDRRHRTIVDPGKGKPSKTSYRVIERLGPYSYVEARPETGRTHQIRVHLAAVGAPVAVDALYGIETPIYLSSFKRGYTPGAREERPLLGRLGLHASHVTFQHTATDSKITIDAPLPKDLRATLNQLRKYAGQT